MTLFGHHNWRHRFNEQWGEYRDWGRWFRSSTWNTKLTLARNLLKYHDGIPIEPAWPSLCMSPWKGIVDMGKSVPVEKQVLLRALLRQLPAGRSYGGLDSSNQCIINVWLEGGSFRLKVQVMCGGESGCDAISIRHVVLLHQGWMKRHDASVDSDWYDLDVNYADNFILGNTYQEAVRAWSAGYRIWGSPVGQFLLGFDLRRIGIDLGIEFGYGSGAQVWRAEKPYDPHDSFVHFHTSSNRPPFTTGTEPALAIEAIELILRHVGEGQPFRPLSVAIDEDRP